MSKPCHAYYQRILIGKKDSAKGETSIQSRYRDAMNGYCDGVLQHVRSSSRQEIPAPEDYLETRKLSSGCEPLYALVEYVQIKTGYRPRTDWI
jgi:hypothetical protein